MSEDSEYDETDKNVGFLYRAMRNRDPHKRRVKPVQKHLMQVNFGGDDSDNDSDFQLKQSDLSEDDDAGMLPSEAADSSRPASEQGDSEGDQDMCEDNNDGDDDESDDDDCTDDDLTDDDDDDESEESEEDVDKPKKNYFDALNTDDEEDDEDYVPKKKRKVSRAHKHGSRASKPTQDYVPKKKQKHRVKSVEKHAEKQRIRSPEVAIQGLTETAEDSQSARTMKVMTCCVCLGDISETDDEIVECDNCGVAVHEGCYGISDTQSAASTESSASTEPWFCDACKAGVKPDCELCPNEGGIFKETDAGKWVHLVCALYTPGVAFGDVDKLSPVTLFEMPYSKWGLRECSLCEDSRFSRTGVCVSCDAGMCRSFFHVTCAQRNGLLSEASPDEDIADPFYAYCKLHADKITSRAKRRNYLAIQSHVRQHANIDIIDEKGKSRLKRKLLRHRQKYAINKKARPASWVPPQKMVRFLTSSPSAVKKMLRKAELMGIITQSHHVIHSTEKQERKKSHGAPTLTAHFVTYYLDRNIRIEKMRADLKELEKQNEKLRTQDTMLRHQYDRLLKNKVPEEDPNARLRLQGRQLWSIISDLSNKPVTVPDLFTVKKPVVKSPTMRKQFPKSAPTVFNQCGKCLKSHDQHLLAKCDKCHLWYHLACLNPPLTRMPKKTSRWGWQCSECADTSSEESEDSTPVNVDAPRRLRDKINQPAKLSRAQQDMEFLFPSVKRRRDRKKQKLHQKVLKKKARNQIQKKTNSTKFPVEDISIISVDDEASNSTVDRAQSVVMTLEGSSNDAEWPAGILAHDVTPSPGTGGIEQAATLHVVDISDDSSMDTAIKQENIPVFKQHTPFQDVSRTGRKIIKKRHYDDQSEESDTSPWQPKSPGKKSGCDQVPSKQRSASKTPPEKTFASHCLTCSKIGTRKDMVSCDSCEHCYHFQCLEPPAKKTPKQRGYNWFCEACDVSDESEEENG